MSRFVLWQKPYAECADIRLIENGIIFAPFCHSRHELEELRNYIVSNDMTGLKQFHDKEGYIYNTQIKTIKKYIDTFIHFHSDDLIIIPSRSYNEHGNKNIGYLVRPRGNYYYGFHFGLYGLFYNVDILENEYHFQGGIRKSLQCIS